MQIPLQITIRDMEHSEALETHIRDRHEQKKEMMSRR